MKINIYNRKPSSSFTLIELLVVVAIIGLLSTLSMIGLNTQRAKARDASRAQQIKGLSSAIELYYLTNNQYPLWSAGGCVNNPGSLLSVLVPSFLNALPRDPKNSDYCYIYKSDTYGQNYRLAAYMESNTDLATKDGGTLNSYYELYSDSSYAQIANASNIISSWSLSGDSSLVGYWKFDEDSGTSAADSSGYGNTGTLSCSGSGCTNPVWQSSSNCIHERCIYFAHSGTGETVQVADADSLDLNGDMTMEFWLYENRSEGLDGYVYRKVYSSKFYIGPTGTVYSYWNLNNSEYSIAKEDGSVRGSWHHFVSTLKNTTGTASWQNRLYRDGIYSASQTNTNAALPTVAQNQNLFLGGRLNELGYIGYMDEVRSYSRALSACEICKRCRAYKDETFCNSCCSSACSGQTCP